MCLSDDCQAPSRPLVRTLGLCAMQSLDFWSSSINIWWTVCRTALQTSHHFDTVRPWVFFSVLAFILCPSLCYLRTSLQFSDLRPCSGRRVKQRSLSTRSFGSSVMSPSLLLFTVRTSCLQKASRLTSGTVSSEPHLCGGAAAAAAEWT